MRTTKRIAMWLCLVMLAVLVARADEWNKKTVVTFSAPDGNSRQSAAGGHVCFQAVRF